MVKFSREIMRHILRIQKNEITEYKIYLELSNIVKNKKNKQILESIASDELRHYNFWKLYTKVELEPNMLKVKKFVLVSKIFGLTFGVRLMEKGESGAQQNYQSLLGLDQKVSEIINDEEEHEQQLIEMIDEDFLNYVGSIVLGLNDALVELTGALAGLSFALQNTNMVAVSGLIMGVAASFSMAGSEYLSNKVDGNTKIALKSSLYTGLAYVFTVVLLILPYFLVDNYIVALSITISIAILIILFFNYYVSIAKRLNFKKRFLEMVFISLGVAFISFVVGLLVRRYFGVDV